MSSDVLNTVSAPDSTWSTTNLSESIPGVPTPLGWSIWDPAGELAVRRTFRAIGALSASEAEIPDRREERLMGIFHGRAALRVDLICRWVERIPGSDSAQAAQAAFSAVPEGYVSRNDYRYFPRVLARATTPFFTAPKLIRQQAPAVRGLHAQALAQLPKAELSAARKWLADGVWHWHEGLFRNTLVTMGAVQPAIDMLERLASAVGMSGQELMAGYGGHEETEVVGDAWECSRGRLSLARFLERHGYHGWEEGEISAPVWRESPERAENFITRYAARADDEDPQAAERERQRRRQELERELLAKLPWWRRAEGRLALTLAATYVPLRGAGKVTFLLGLDVARAGARRVGELLALDGVLQDPSDVFFLTYDELQGGSPRGHRELIAERRAARGRYQDLRVPEVFRGVPEPSASTTHAGNVIRGTAAGPGVVEGPVRVILAPDDADIQPGEILVGHTTDPSWASLMFLSSGLIADIGGTLSHTAVVARELGLPCVVNTKVATSALRTGDVVRLDGSGGRIEILYRAAPAAGTRT